MQQRNFKLWSRSGGLSPGPQGPNHPDSSLRSGQCSGTGSAAPVLTFSNGETEAWQLNGLALESKISLLEPNTIHVHKIPDSRQPRPHSRRNTVTNCSAPLAQERLSRVEKITVFDAQRHWAASSSTTCPFPPLLGFTSCFSMTFAAPER